MKVLQPGNAVVVTKSGSYCPIVPRLAQHHLRIAGARLRARQPRRHLVRHTSDVGRPVPAIMGDIAAFERSLIGNRCQVGTKFGRPTALDAGERKRIAERYAGGEMAELAREYEVGEATI